MAGEYLEFTNNTTPALSGPNMNLMQQKIREDIHGTVLYETENGTTGNVTLNDDADNYDYIEIFAHRGTRYFSHKLYKPDTKTIGLLSGTYVEENVYIYVQQNTINGTTITRGKSALAQFGNETTVHVFTEENAMYIDKVVGYKYVE